MDNIKNVIVGLPFDGGIMTVLNKDGKPAYTQFNSFDEYKAARQEPGKELVLMSWDEYDIIYKKYWQSDFKELTEDQYTIAFEELPPLKYHWINATMNVFFCSEAMSGQFHSCYLYDKTKNKFYSALISVFSTDAEILAHYSKTQN